MPPPCFIYDVNRRSRATASGKPMKSVNSWKGVIRSATALVKQPAAMKRSIMVFTALCIANMGSIGQIA